MKEEYVLYISKYASQKQGYSTLLKRLKKNKKGLDILFYENHEKAFEEINCLECGNCCRTISPIFKMKDIERLAKHLKLKPAAFIERYLYMDSESDYVLQKAPCSFFGADNYCSVYDYRPTACREYPHTNHRNMSSHLKLAEKNGATCPAVVKVLDLIDEALQAK